MGSKLNNLRRILSWSDFKKRERPAPKPGHSAAAAKTDATFSLSPIRFEPVPGSKPVIYKLKDDVIMDIGLTPNACWVANWVFKLPQDHQDALLDHEAGHYKIVALLARDFFVEVMQLKLNDYSSPHMGLNAFNQIRRRYTSALIQSVQDKYDSSEQTNHDPVKNANQQALWNGYFSDAFTHETPLLGILRAARLLP